MGRNHVKPISQAAVTYLKFKEFVLQSFLTRVVAGLVKQHFILLDGHAKKITTRKRILLSLEWIHIYAKETKETHIANLTNNVRNWVLNRHYMSYRIVFCYSADLVVIISSAQWCQAIWVEPSTCRIQLISVIFSQFSLKRVDGNDKSSSVCFKLGKNNNVNLNWFGIEYTSCTHIWLAVNAYLK